MFLRPSDKIIMYGKEVLKGVVKIILSMTILLLFQLAEEILTKAYLRHGF